MFESSRYYLAWGPPSFLAGNLLVDLRYSVTYCHSSCLTTLATGNATDIVLKSLLPNEMYTYSITVINKDDLNSNSTNGTFNTSICNSNQYRCPSNKCIDKKTKLCDFVSDCADGSDESTTVGCSKCSFTLYNNYICIL